MYEVGARGPVALGAVPYKSVVKSFIRFDVAIYGLSVGEKRLNWLPECALSNGGKVIWTSFFLLHFNSIMFSDHLFNLWVKGIRSRGCAQSVTVVPWLCSCYYYVPLYECTYIHIFSLKCITCIIESCLEFILYGYYIFCGCARNVILV